jgi:DNA-binding MarR family transcriptional regulator
MIESGDEREERAGLTSALDREMLTASAQAILLSEAVAARLGLHPTDVECLEILGRHGAITPGQIAALTGLTTGAVTRLVDRLERAGYARRAPDTHDRRRVLIEPATERIRREIGPLYAALGAAMAALYDRYSTTELAAIVDYAARSNRLVREHIARLGQNADSEGAATAPHADA